MKKNLEGQTFGELTVLKRADTKGRTKWTCRCSCGTVKDINEYDLISGKSKSCGCKRRRKPKDISGKRYGKLIAKEIVGMGDNGTSFLFISSLCCSSFASVSTLLERANKCSSSFSTIVK